MFKKALSPVLASIILASVSLAIGIAILMWLSSQSTLSLRETQIESVKANIAARENLVIIHAYYNGSHVIIYLCNMGYMPVFLGPLRIYSSSLNNIVAYPATNYTLYVIHDSSVSEVTDKSAAPIGSISEFAEKLNIKDLSLIPNNVMLYTVKPYFESNEYYMLVFSKTLSSGTYTVELWSASVIYGKAYLIRPHIEVISV